MSTLTIKTEQLTSEAFAPFGDVIEIEGAEHFSINDGTVERFHDLASVDVGVEENGRTLISICRCNQPASLPYKVPFVERHPLGTQAFIPMDETPIVVMVAPVGDKVSLTDLKAFVSNGKQGINYHRGIWHMPLIPVTDNQLMLIVDRGGPGDNCDEYYFPDDEIIVTY